MTMRKSVVILAALAVGASTMTGCSGKRSSQHEKNKQAAIERYAAMRTGVMLQKAQQEFDTGDLNLAEKSVKDALSIDPKNAKLHVLGGRIALERGQLERSYHLFNMAIEYDAKLPMAYYYQGVVHQRWQQYDKALDCYRQAYDLERDNVSYLLAQSEMLVELDRVDEAIVLLEEQLIYFDQNPGIRAALAHMYKMKSQPAKSVHYFEQAALLDPDNLKLREELALAQLAAGQTERAIDSLKRVLDDPGFKNRRDLLRALAAAQLKTGRVDQAKQVYIDLTRSGKGEAADWVKLGELCFKGNDLFGALQAANQAIQLEPQRHEGYMLAGMVWQKRNRLDEALQMFDRAAELAPAEAAPLILRGISLERAGRKAAAAQAYQQALQRRPDDARAQRLLANVQ